MKSWGQTGTEFHSFREYQRGDDIRRINWKASARSTSLIVRETALEGIRRCTVVLDMTAAEYSASSFEQAVIAAASITASSAHTGVNTRFVTNEVDLRGPDVAANTLRWLATVEPVEEVPEMASMNSGMSEGMGLLVLVTGSFSSNAAGTTPGGGDPGRDPGPRLRYGLHGQQQVRRRRHIDRVDDRFMDTVDRRVQPGGDVVTAAIASNRVAAKDNAEPMSAHVPATIALTLLTVVTAVSLCRVFPDWAYLRPMLVVCIGIHAVMCLSSGAAGHGVARPARRPGGVGDSDQPDLLP